MDMIVNIVGASGTGKTTIARELSKKGYNVIQSYTTRKPREPNEWGHTFIDKEEFENSIAYLDFDLGIDIIARAKLYGEYYWATREQYRGKGVSIYIVDPKGAEQVKENVKDAKVITVVLMADQDAVRYRMKKQARLPQDLDNRLRKDGEIFKVIECDYVVNANQSKEVVTKSMEDLIEREILNGRE